MKRARQKSRQFDGLSALQAAAIKPKASDQTTIGRLAKETEALQVHDVAERGRWESRALLLAAVCNCTLVDQREEKQGDSRQRLRQAGYLIGQFCPENVELQTAGLIDPGDTRDKCYLSGRFYASLVFFSIVEILMSEASDADVDNMI